MNVYDYAQTITLPLQLSAPCDVWEGVGFNVDYSSSATSADYKNTTWVNGGEYCASFGLGATVANTSIVISNRPGLQGSRTVVMVLAPVYSAIAYTLGANTTFTLTILDKEVAITTPPLDQTVNWGGAANFSVVAAGAPPFYYQWMKNGLNISGATNVSYTTPPAVVADKSATFSVLVSNAYSCATSGVANLTVVSNPLPTVNINQPGNGAQFTPPANLMINAIANAGGFGSIQKVDFYNNGTQWLGVVTTLPANPYGLSLNNLASGTYNLTAVVTDNQNQTATSSVVQVTVTGSYQPALSIVTASALTTATVGFAYNQILTASGGTPGYTWSVISNGLPAGLGLVANSGAITGTPVNVCTTSFTARVTDAVGSNVCRVFSLTVQSAYNKWCLQALGTTNVSIGGHLATPAHDGIANLVKFALGIDPLTPGYQDHLSCGMTNLSGENCFALTCIRPNPAPLGVTYAFDAADDVRANAWSNATITVSTNIHSDGTATITVHDNASGSLTRFLRLIVNVIP